MAPPGIGEDPKRFSPGAASLSLPSPRFRSKQLERNLRTKPGASEWLGRADANADGGAGSPGTLAEREGFEPSRRSRA